jgi:HEPN domain-containing protein
MQDNAKDWLSRAKSNLEHARRVNKDDLSAYGGYIFYEELCFGLQQCVEKSLKALLIHLNIEFPKTHAISKLIELLKDNAQSYPDRLLEAIDLTVYAVDARYPSIQDIVSEKEYLLSLEIAQSVYDWVSKQIRR